MNATRAVTVSSRTAAPRPRRRARRARPAWTERLAALFDRPRADADAGHRRAARAGDPRSSGRATTGRCAALSRPRRRGRGRREGDRHLGRRAAGRQGDPLAPRQSARWPEAIVARGRGRGGRPHGAVVERLRQKRVREPPPLLFDLTSLQRTANRRFGLQRRATLEAAQALYERHKILTYPRTDSRHLTSDMAKELPKLFGALAALPDYAPFAAAAAGRRRRRARGASSTTPRCTTTTPSSPPASRCAWTSCRATSGASSIWWRAASWASSTPTPSSR